MNVKIRKLDADAVVPTYAKPDDSGFDLVAIADVVIAPGETALVPTGLVFEVVPSYEMQIRPRSGVTARTKLRVQFGTVDAGFRGEVAVIVDNTNPPTTIVSNRLMTPDGTVETDALFPVGTFVVRKNDRIAQGVIAPIERAEFTVVDELSGTERGAGGFGHTGVKNKEVSE